jgi:hypothetical protein
MNKKTLDGQRLIGNPLFRDRLLQLQARMLAKNELRRRRTGNPS